MIKVILAAALVAFVYVNAQNNHHPPHIAHPGGNVNCHGDADCAGCGTNYTGFCDQGTCYCKLIVKRAGACHNNNECSSQCPNGHGVCNSHTNMCDCDNTVPVGKRANNCNNNHDCSSQCPSGHGVCKTHQDGTSMCECENTVVG